MGFPTHILTKMIRVEINVRAVFAGTRARVLSDKGPIEWDLMTWGTRVSDPFLAWDKLKCVASVTEPANKTNQKTEAEKSSRN